MLIDDVTVRIHAGPGGKGMVAFEGNKLAIGPTGGSGGHGGSIFCTGILGLNGLVQFRNKKEVRAGAGGNGRGQFVDGSRGDDVTLELPLGTVVTNVDTGETFDLVTPGEPIRIARGGRGGRGNFLFRSSRNTSPQEFEEGKPGQSFTFRFQLRLIADVGFIGLPNAGKSSLLNQLTGAQSKVANYPFTTLEPSLGAYYELILADIPGLIEGASSGKGLGIKFLQHIERTKTLFHLISAESDDVTRDYHIVRTELGQYNPALLEKPEYVFLSKHDMVSPADAAQKLKVLQKLNANAGMLSIHDEASLKQVQGILNKIKG